MKIKGAKLVHYESGPNMIPLVDVVMVLLIFLMLVGQFGGMEHYLISNLPYTEKGLGGAKPLAGAVPDEPLDIRVDSSASGGWVARVGKIQTSNMETLAGQLTTMHENLNKVGTKTDKIQVVISPGKNVKYDYLVGVYQAAMDANFTKISFASSH